MFRRSTLTVFSLAGFTFACGFASGEGFAQGSGSQRLFIESVKPPQNRSTAFVARYGLTRDDLRNIRKHVTGLKAVIPLRIAGAEVRYGAQTTDVRLCGTDENYSHKLNPEKLRGRFLFDNDVTHLNNVAVIGDRVANRLFGNRDPIGRNVRIGKDYYLIVGRLEFAALQQDSSDEASVELSHSVFIPISTMRARTGNVQIVRAEGAFFAESYELSSIEIEFVPENLDDTLRIGNSIRTILEINHPEQDYKLRLMR